MLFRSLRGLKNTNGDPLFKQDLQGSTQYALDGSPMNFPNNGAFDKSKALMISGDFSQLVYSIRQDITFKLFTEGVVQNTDGTIAYNLMQNDMVALRAVMRLGWEIPNPINSLKTDKTKRCPFAVLKSGEYRKVMIHAGHVSILCRRIWRKNHSGTGLSKSRKAGGSLYPAFDLCER